MIKQYRKKPVVIDAFLLWPVTTNKQAEAIAWCNGSRGPDGGVYINTLEGKMYAATGDYIIKGVNGEFYPCKPDIFEKTYEPA